jgi:hypothetical protein
LFEIDYFMNFVTVLGGCLKLIILWTFLAVLGGCFLSVAIPDLHVSLFLVKYILISFQIMVSTVYCTREASIPQRLSLVFRNTVWHCLWAQMRVSRSIFHMLSHKSKVCLHHVQFSGRPIIVFVRCTHYVTNLYKNKYGNNYTVQRRKQVQHLNTMNLLDWISTQ